MHNNLFSLIEKKIGLEIVDLDLGVSLFTQWNSIHPFKTVFILLFIIYYYF